MLYQWPLIHLVVILHVGHVSWPSHLTPSDVDCVRPHFGGLCLSVSIDVVKHGMQTRQPDETWHVLRIT